MNVALALICFVSLTLGCATLVTQGGERAFLRRTVLTAWVGFVPLVIFINEWLAFTGGGDDESYYWLAATPISSLADTLDLTRFTGVMEQPGYPWLLSLLNYYSGQDLLVFKLLNLTLFILLSIVWYRIGTLLESPSFGRAVAVGILLLTPLWYYTWFLLKDMTIVLLQSLFLLGVVMQSKRNTAWSWLLIGIATFAVMLFRSVLVLQNVVVLITALMLRSLAGGNRLGRVVPLICGAVVIAGLLAVASNVEMMETIGITALHRIVGSVEMGEGAAMAYESSPMDRTLFPAVYLLSETSGLSPLAWTQFDSFWLRGALALPWIFLVLPFFVFGLVWLMRREPSILLHKGILHRIRHLRLVAKPWGILVLFIISYIAFSWQVGDTTRWRIPDMPVIATVAVAGWRSTPPQLRRQVLLLWIAGVGLLLVMFYLLRGQ